MHDTRAQPQQAPTANIAEQPGFDPNRHSSKAEQAAHAGELRHLFAAFDALPPERAWGDAEMYDDDGLPR